MAMVECSGLLLLLVFFLTRADDLVPPTPTPEDGTTVFPTVPSQDRMNNPANLDRFNYRETEVGSAQSDYGPRDWGNVRCEDLESCVSDSQSDVSVHSEPVLYLTLDLSLFLPFPYQQGWPDDYKAGIGWSLSQNSCKWCPSDVPEDSQADECRSHHQSPINLQRNRAIEGNPLYNYCVDSHWMAYYDSTCSWSDLKKHNAFSIERHALKVTQPLEYIGNNTYQVACYEKKRGNVFGKIDFSKGFSQWWHLSHMDVHVPSEHFQEGKQYAGELQLHHFYSVSAEEAGVHNEMATVSIFLHTYEGVEDFQPLNKLICAWRQVEEQTREQCGKASVYEPYPGCYPYTREHNTQRRGLRKQGSMVNTTIPTKPLSVHDILVHNKKQARLNPKYQHKKVLIHDDDHPENSFDWDTFIKEQTLTEPTQQQRRKLMNYDHLDWFNYFPMLGCKTEYYFRYSGTQTVPPCYGIFGQGEDRANSNNWRVMKDPILVSQRQLDELHRLLRTRIAPPDDPLVPCQSDTAGRVEGSKIAVNRPLQATHKAHHKVFCECENWESKFPEDVEWCLIQNKLQRFYDHPYNFDTEGF